MENKFYRQLMHGQKMQGKLKMYTKLILNLETINGKLKIDNLGTINGILKKRVETINTKCKLNLPYEPASGEGAPPAWSRTPLGSRGSRSSSCSAEK